MKVLSSYPAGCASVAALTADLAILSSSGRDWTDRMRRLASRMPQLDIFTQQLVLRDRAGWHLTEAGRQILLALEKPAAAMPPEIEQAPPQPAQAELPIELPRVRSMASDRRYGTIEPIRRDAGPAARTAIERRFAVIEGGKA